MMTWWEVVGEIERGSFVAVHIEGEWPEHSSPTEVDAIHAKLARRVGHGQFAVVLLYGNADVEVVGPEGMHSVLAALSAAQLRNLEEACHG